MKKGILDITMFIIIILLMKLNFTGIIIHEIIGLIVFALFLLHKYINFKWIKAITKSFLKVKNKVRIMYIVDILLFIIFTFVIVSGILISQVLFHSKGSILLSNLHHFSAAVGFILLFIHLLLHLHIVTSKIKSNNKSKYIYILLSLIILISSIGIIFRDKFLNYITVPFIKNQNNIIDNVTDDSSDDDKLIEDSNENDDETIKDTPTLEEYLSKLFCNGCGRHCPLSSPGCNRGYSYREEAANRYYEKYNTSYNDNKNYIVSIENYTVSINNKNI